MPRKKKEYTPEELEKRRKFWARYKTYEGEKGSTESWRRAAAALGTIKDEAQNSALKLLGLTSMPLSITELNKARRRAIFAAHPDKTGSTEQAVKINQAYDEIRALLERK